MRALLRLIFLNLALLVPTTGVPAAAVAEGSCLGQVEQRREVRSGNVVRPGSLGRQLGGKVVRLKLCRGGAGLVWQVTVLNHDGRVMSHVVDARSGRLIR